MGAPDEPGGGVAALALEVGHGFVEAGDDGLSGDQRPKPVRAGGGAEIDVGGVDEAGLFVGDHGGFVDLATGGDGGGDGTAEGRLGGQDFLGQEQLFDRRAQELGGEEKGGEFGNGGEIADEDGGIKGAGVEAVDLAVTTGETGRR